MRFLAQVQKYVRGDPVENPHPAIVLHADCAAMRWNHLPRTGLMDDQDPDLMARWRIIRREQAEHQERENQRRDAESKRQSNSRTMGRPRRRR